MGNAGAVNLVQVPVQGEPFLELNDLINQADGFGKNDLDLNQPLDDDLGGIEDLIQAADAMEEGALQAQEEQTIIEDVHSDNSEDELDVQPMINLNDPNEVNVFIPMDWDVPLQLIPAEIHEDELLGEPSPNSDQAQLDVLHNDNMQLGFVETFFPVVDLVFASIQNDLQSASSELIRQWARNFAPGPGAHTVQVPLQWSPFFTSMLLNPGNFLWAKKFLESSAWDFFSSSLSDSRPFALPKYCPTSVKISCMKDVVEFEQYEDLLTDNNTIEKDSQPVEMDKTSLAKLAKN